VKSIVVPPTVAAVPIQKLYFIRGNIKLDLDILLEVNSPDMENILPSLADFIDETDRF
jgi:hypothetical protein